MKNYILSNKHFSILFLLIICITIYFKFNSHKFLKHVMEEPNPGNISGVWLLVDSARHQNKYPKLSNNLKILIFEDGSLELVDFMINDLSGTGYNVINDIGRWLILDINPYNNPSDLAKWELRFSLTSLSFNFGMSILTKDNNYYLRYIDLDLDGRPLIFKKISSTTK